MVWRHIYRATYLSRIVPPVSQGAGAARRLRVRRAADDASGARPSGAAGIFFFADDDHMRVLMLHPGEESVSAARYPTPRCASPPVPALPSCILYPVHLLRALRTHIGIQARVHERV